MAGNKIVTPEEQPRGGNGQERKLIVEFVSNKSVLDTLSSWRKTFKVIATLFAVVLALFFGLAVATIAIKRTIPYNDIWINAYGATTMQNEDTELIYWLFNTADLWANSGIRVEAGDRLTFRASGRSNTAIHHLVDSANANLQPRYDWVDTEGRGATDATTRDARIAPFRIFPNQSKDALVMQVVPEKYESIASISPEAKRNQFLTPWGLDMLSTEQREQQPENYYFIGEERGEVLIYEDGVLHFAINEMVLTRPVIAHLKNFLGDSLFGKTDTIPELDYYCAEDYYNAWFDDNIGSFLVVIERKTKRL